MHVDRFSLAILSPRSVDGAGVFELLQLMASMHTALPGDRKDTNAKFAPALITTLNTS